MSFDIDALMRLGELDRELIRERRRLDNAPSIAAPQRHRVEAAKAELETLKAESKKNQRQVTSLEGEAESKRAEITKAQVALNQAKDNEAYQSLLRTIETKQSELSDIETGILEAYEAQDDRESREKAGKERLAQQEKELKAAEGRVAVEVEKVKGELTRLDSERVEAAKAISGEHLDLYEKILVAKEDSAIAQVIDEMCQGCYIRCRPEQISKVRGRQELILCTTCGRILWGQFDS